MNPIHAPRLRHIPSFKRVTHSLGTGLMFHLANAARFCVAQGKPSRHLTSCLFGGVMAFSLLSNQSALAQSPEGYTRCASEGGSFTLPAKSHVAYGADGHFLYLFNQTGTITFNQETFGSDPIYGVWKSGYYKIATDNESAYVLSAAMDKISSHLSGTATLRASQINEQTAIIQANIYLIADNATVLTKAFDLVRDYETNQGPIFLNSATNGGFPNSPGATDGFELVRAIFMIQQGIFDYAYTPELLNKYRTLLDGRTYLTSAWFPGAVAPSVNPNTTYTAKINASMPKDWGKPTAFSQSPTRRPTGYYLAPGIIGTVTVPISMVNKGFKVLVGAHTVDMTGKSQVRRFSRVTKTYPITSTTTTIANPFGGGIYIITPYEANAGIVDVQIVNALPSPLFSATSFKQTTLEEWQNVQRLNPGPWADFVTDKFMMQVPTTWIYNFNNPVTLMNNWDKEMDGVSELFGYPLIRNNYILYVQVDTDIMGGSYSIGYPQVNTSYNPHDVEIGNKNHWFLTNGINFWETEFHELSHAQMFSKFEGEAEATVNLTSAYIYNRKYGMDIDLAFGNSFSCSLSPVMNRDQAAITWMVTPNFRAGKPMDISNTSHDEVRYQYRGYGKYIEIAALFGWDKLCDFYKQENLDYIANTPNDGLTSTDSRIFRMSKAAGVDLRPLIHFWGVQPVDHALLQDRITAAGLLPSSKIYDRLIHYKSIVPMNNAQFADHAHILYPGTINPGASSDYGEGWYYVWLQQYNESHGIAAQTATQNIIDLYFPGYNSTPLINITAPTANSTIKIGNVVNINAAVSGNNINRVEFYINNSLIATDTTSPYSYTWNTTGLQAQTANIKTIVFNTLNQSSSSNIAVSLIDANTSGPSGYIKCANENQSFSLTGPCNVAYGANGKFYYQSNVTGTITFNNATFGDPIPGVVKSGYYKALSNLALGRVTSQSSNISALYGSSSLAVDGITEGSLGENLLTFTNFDPQAWWKVDLGESCDVYSVVLWLPTDGSSDTLSNFHVDYLDDNENIIAKKDYPGMADNMTVIDMRVKGVRVIKIQLYGTSNLSLIEAQVMGTTSTKS